MKLTNGWADSQVVSWFHCSLHMASLHPVTTACSPHKRHSVLVTKVLSSCMKIWKIWTWWRQQHDNEMTQKERWKSFVNSCPWKDIFCSQCEMLQGIRMASTFTRSCFSLSRCFKSQDLMRFLHVVGLGMESCGQFWRSHLSRLPSIQVYSHLYSRYMSRQSIHVDTCRCRCGYDGNETQKK